MFGWLHRLFEKRAGKLVCMRLAEMQFMHQDQVTKKCSVCYVDVGVYPSGQDIIVRYGKRVQIVCHHCAGDLTGSVLAPGALEEKQQSVRKE